MSIAIPGIGTKLKRGDGTGATPTAASKTIGTGNSLLKVEAKVAGAAGNSKQFGIIVSGNNTAFSIVVTSSSVTINSATDGGGLATTTVDHAIAALYQNSTFRDNFIASTTGNGSGVLVAGALANLTGGADSPEVFTLVPGVIDLGGPNRSRDLIDVTSMDSADYYREFIVGLKDGGAISGELNYKPSETQHNGMNTDFEDDVLRNWQLEFRDGTVFSFSAYVESFEVTSPIDAQLKASFSLKITGPVTVDLP